MVKKITDYIKSDVVFDDVEKVDKETLVGKNIVVKAYATREGDNGKFCIALLDVEGKTVKVTFSSIILDKLNQAALGIGIDDELKNKFGEYHFLEPVSGTLVYRKGKKNKYYDLE